MERSMHHSGGSHQSLIEILDSCSRQNCKLALQDIFTALDKTRLQHVLTATVINCIRIDDFLAGAKMEQTRTSHFAALAPEKVA